MDASITLAWCFADEEDGYAEGVLKALATTRILVPSHWAPEVSNALLMAERRGRTQPADTARAVALLTALPIDRDEHTADRAMHDTLSLAKAYGLTVYEAAYLELALREGSAIASLDANLEAAATKAGVQPFKP